MILALALLACDRDVTLVTYNAGLATGFVDAAVERTVPTSEAVAALGADVICVQEVWSPEQAQAMTDAATDAGYAEAVFMAPQVPADTGTPACPDGEIDDLVACAQDSCGDMCVDDLVDCVFDSCALDFLRLDDTCQECVMAEVGNDPEAIRSTCEAHSPGYAYGASFGIGLLSKSPLTSVDEVVFDSTTNRRGALHAVVDSPVGELDVYCTHLSAVFAVIPYPKPEGSWAEEQGAQIDALVSWVDGSSTADLAVVMGDFNTGPAFAGGVEEVPDSWAKLAATGWATPYAEQAAPACTFCADNPLNAGGDGESVLIDHIFVAGEFTGDAAPSRVLDGSLDTTSCGAPLAAAYSDHYGVQVTLTR